MKEPTNSGQQFFLFQISEVVSLTGIFQMWQIFPKINKIKSQSLAIFNRKIWEQFSKILSFIFIFHILAKFLVLIISKTSKHSQVSS
jgi:hypothetical protein